MPEKDSEIVLPPTEEILAAYEKLFGGGKRGVRRFKQSGLRYVRFPGDVILVEQNPEKESHWAELARRGRRIAWLMKDGKYLARVVDSEVEILRH